MTYTFDVEIAKISGVDCAVFYCNLLFWVNKNRDNKKNYHDEKYWTYNSIEEYCKIFPFWSAGQIRRIIQNLIDKNLIISGSFNDNPYNKTKWYSLANPINTDLLKSTDGFAEINNCTFAEIDKSTIHIVNSDITTQTDMLRTSEDINEISEKTNTKKEFDLEFNEMFEALWSYYRKYIKQYRNAYGSKKKAYKVVKKALEQLKNLNEWEDNNDMFSWFGDYINDKLNKQYTPNLENLPFDDFEDFAEEEKD